MPSNSLLVYHRSCISVWILLCLRLRGRHLSAFSHSGPGLVLVNFWVLLKSLPPVSLRVSHLAALVCLLPSVIRDAHMSPLLLGVNVRVNYQHTSEPVRRRLSECPVCVYVCARMHVSMCDGVLYSLDSGVKHLAKVPHLPPGGTRLQISPLGALETELALLGGCGSLISAGLHPSSFLYPRQSSLVLSSSVMAIVWQSSGGERCPGAWMPCKESVWHDS